MGWLSKIWGVITNTEQVQVRARNKKGRYVADDKSTPDKNEAYINVSAALNAGKNED